MAPTSGTQEISMPSGFPDGVLEEVMNRICAKVNSPDDREHLVGSRNGVRLRLRACADYSQEFTASVAQAGDAPAAETRYQQERQLFGFFVSGLAALDSLGFFLYFVGSHLRPTDFATNKLWKIDLNSATEAFDKTFPSEALSSKLQGLKIDPVLENWKDVRNILAHRAAPGRVIYGSVGGASPAPTAEWKIHLHSNRSNLKIDCNLTPPFLGWLISTLGGLIVAADGFTQAHL